MKQKLGKKEKKEKGAHFYSNPMSMNLDEELGSNEMKMKRAARFDHFISIYVCFMLLQSKGSERQGWRRERSL